MRSIKLKKGGETVLYLNKSIVIICVLAGMCLSACSSHDKGYYERANKASEKAHEKLDRE